MKQQHKTGDKLETVEWEIRRILQEAARDDQISTLAAFNLGLSLGSLPYVAAVAPEDMAGLIEKLRAQVATRDLDPGIAGALEELLDRLERGWSDARTRQPRPDTPAR